MSRTQKLAAGSVAIGIAVLALKYLAYVLTGSLALYSDALETIVNVVAAAVALYTLRLSETPADAGHPFGHTKAEYFSAVLEGALILVAALLILREAVPALWHPHALGTPILGLAVSSGGTLLNVGWGGVLIRAGRKIGSPALVADGRHLMADVVTSVGVAIGVVLVVVTGMPVLDPALATLVACYIVWTGFALMRESLSFLMDEAAPEETLARIRRLIGSEGGGAIEAHDIRTRHAGQMTFLEFHLVVPGTMSVAEAHDICDRLEAALRAELRVQTTIHIEPEGKAKHAGVVIRHERGDDMAPLG